MCVVPSARLRSVISAPSASRETEATVDLKPLQTWKTPARVERRTIAAVAEGKLRSAFTGDDLGVRAPASAATDRARVFVVASAQFFANPFARAGNATEGSKSGMSMAGSPEAMPGDEQLAPIARTYGGSVMGGTLRVLGSTLAWMTAEAALARCAEPKTP